MGEAITAHITSLPEYRETSSISSDVAALRAQTMALEGHVAASRLEAKTAHRTSETQFLARIAVLDDKLSSLSGENVGLQEKLAASEAARVTLRNDLEATRASLQKELESTRVITLKEVAARASVQDVEAVRASLQKELDTTRQENTSLRSQLQQELQLFRNELLGFKEQQRRLEDQSISSAESLRKSLTGSLASKEETSAELQKLRVTVDTTRTLAEKAAAESEHNLRRSQAQLKKEFAEEIGVHTESLQLKLHEDIKVTVDAAVASNQALKDFGPDTLKLKDDILQDLHNANAKSESLSNNPFTVLVFESISDKLQTLKTEQNDLKEDLASVKEVQGSLKDDVGQLKTWRDDETKRDDRSSMGPDTDSRRSVPLTGPVRAQRKLVLNGAQGQT